jgi:hypothetical protein
MTPTASLQALLTGAIDYAGLFPPAKLTMHDAVARYADYRGVAESWALGRFVIPVARLDEFASALASVGATRQGWRLSGLLGDDPAADGPRIRSFNAKNAGSAFVDAAEMKVVGSPSAAHRTIAAAVEQLPASTRLFVELPLGEELPAFMAAVATERVGAKVRTGGTTPDAFPNVRQLAQFLLCCAEHDTHFKATAGLHHPWRGRYALTYEPQSSTATMFGFLNLLIAAAFARKRTTEEDVVDVLRMEGGSDVRFNDDEIRWREWRIETQELLETHATFALAFGSCSFEEPVADLRRLALL